MELSLEDLLEKRTQGMMQPKLLKKLKSKPKRVSLMESHPLALMQLDLLLPL